MNPVYIHYGDAKFDSNKFVPIHNYAGWNKPIGGLWASRVDAPLGWKEWCERENFRVCDEINSFKFTLSPTANIITIDSMEALENLPSYYTLKTEKIGNNTSFYLNFEIMVKDGVDAVELKLSQCYALYWAMYGWDCDSIIVMNKEIIIPIENPT